MPLMEVVLEQRYYNQQIIDRFNYVATGTPAAVTLSFGLLSALGFISTSATLPGTTVGNRLQTLQNPGVEFVQATARAVYIDEDFYGNPFFVNTLGLNTVGGNNMSPVDAYGFRSSRVKQSIRRGYKRFVGVAEGAVGDGGIFTSGTAGAMANLATALGATITFDDEGNTITYVPCIVQKEKYTAPSGKPAYRYYPTELTQAPHLAIGVLWELYTAQRSQTSRQYGHGR